MATSMPAAPRVSEILERVLDKGIVIDASVRVAVAGIDLVTVDARVVVASLQTYLQYAGALGAYGMRGRSDGHGPAALGAPRRDRAALRAVPLDVDARDVDRSAVGGDQAGRDPQERRLAGTVAAGDRRRRARTQAQVDSREYRRRL